MPIYEYICDTCQEEFEQRRSFSSEEGVPPCPTCNGTGKVKRRFSAPAIVFKGKGFYVTDSRAKNSAGKPSSSKEPSSPKESATEKPKSEKKTESEKK